MKINLIAKIKDVSLAYQFEPGVEVTIGREIGNTIAPIVDNLSRHHAKLFARDGKWFAADLGSTNGSYRNGEKFTGEVELKANDALRFGLVDLTVKFDEAAADSTAKGAAAPTPALEPVEVAELKPAAGAKPAAKPSPLSPVTGLKPGLKLPAKPVFGGGIKLPRKPVIKIPPKQA